MSFIKDESLEKTQVQFMSETILDQIILTSRLNSKLLGFLSPRNRMVNEKKTLYSIVFLHDWIVAIYVCRDVMDQCYWMESQEKEINHKMEAWEQKPWKPLMTLGLLSIKSVEGLFLVQISLSWLAVKPFS